MQRWLVIQLAVLTVISGWGVSRVQAQGPAPTAYSITEDPGFALFGPSVVKVSRDGSKEVVDQIMPPMQGRPKEFHSRLFYDLQAHRLYTQVVSDPATPCGVQEYNDPEPAPEIDPIGGSAALMKEISGPDNKSKEVGTETLNGMPTRVVEITSPQGNAKVWFTQKGGFLVKIVSIDKDGKATTMLEVKQISFSKPPASAFALPASCASAQLPPPPAKPGPNVTAVTLEKIGNYTGACPAHLKMVGTITVDSAGPVFYQFGAGNMAPGKTLTFPSAGTKTVTEVMTFQPKYGNQMGGTAILEAIGIDSAGNHSLAMKGSNNSDFNITCTSGGGK
jgi:hypothetical protein